ncbi:hypothetical protein SCLCIDRAFT_1209872 [Scleroderma citrinum Foug A]|uniref:Uncharacterized protein n=1 Tax=Scleroderma citrinum Foug A TaxID=1036808 RepID=A0A0C3E4N0_9AGAM|nr:hypothetical protein SCLCIDRAFT_1209872 [Scleroderma citrinum Foug A]
MIHLIGRLGLTLSPAPSLLWGPHHLQPPLDHSRSFLGTSSIVTLYYLPWPRTSSVDPTSHRSSGSC